MNYFLKVLVAFSNLLKLVCGAGEKVEIGSGCTSCMPRRLAAIWSLRWDGSHPGHCPYCHFHPSPSRWTSLCLCRAAAQSCRSHKRWDSSDSNLKMSH